MNRHEQILKLCELNQYISTAELVKALGVSEATVRRDLVQLEEEQKIRRVHGGAMLNKDDYHPKQMGLNWLPGVERIGCLAASFIKDKQMVFIDSGRTTVALLEYIAAKNISVVTNGIVHARKLSEMNIDTFVLPGFVRYDHCTISSDEAVRYISQFKFDLAFIGTSGIHQEIGLSCNSETSAKIKQVAIKSASKCYVMADSQKFNLAYFNCFASFDDVTIITETKRDDFDYSITNTIFAE